VASGGATTPGRSVEWNRPTAIKSAELSSTVVANFLKKLIPAPQTSPILRFAFSHGAAFMRRLGSGGGRCRGLERRSRFPRRTSPHHPCPFCFGVTRTRCEQGSAKPAPDDRCGGLKPPNIRGRVQGWRSVVRSWCFRSPLLRVDMPGSGDGRVFDGGPRGLSGRHRRDAFRASNTKYTEDVREASRPYLRRQVGGTETKPRWVSGQWRIWHADSRSRHFHVPFSL